MYIYVYVLFTYPFHTGMMMYQPCYWGHTATPFCGSHAKPWKLSPKAPADHHAEHEKFPATGSRGRACLASLGSTTVPCPAGG